MELDLWVNTKRDSQTISFLFGKNKEKDEKYLTIWGKVS